MKAKFKLKATVKDLQNGLTGKVVGHACYLYGEEMYWVQFGEELEHGAIWVSGTRLEETDGETDGETEDDSSGDDGAGDDSGDDAGDTDDSSDDSDDNSDDGETEEETETEEEEVVEEKPAKKSAKKTASKVGAKDSKKTFRAKPQAYDRENKTHKEIFSGVLRKIMPNWKDKAKDRAGVTSKKMAGKAFLDADGEVIESFRAEVKKLMAVKK